MSYWSTLDQSHLGDVTTDTQKITWTINTAWQNRISTYISADTIIRASDGENWASLVIQWLLNTLTYDSSINGGFWTPDHTIIEWVRISWEGKKLWVKLLWIKMSVLLWILDSLPWISTTQKERIRTIDAKFREIFRSKSKKTEL